jgi:hypothetical protein
VGLRSNFSRGFRGCLPNTIPLTRLFSENIICSLSLYILNILIISGHPKGLKSKEDKSEITEGTKAKKSLKQTGNEINPVFVQILTAKFYEHLEKFLLF